VLPLRLDLINACTVGVQAASSAVHMAEQSHVQGQTDVHTMLACHAELRRQRRVFISAVRDYNADIAEYAVGVADPSISDDKLLAMLIRTPGGRRLSSTLPRPGEPTLAPPEPVATAGRSLAGSGEPAADEGDAPSEIGHNGDDRRGGGQQVSGASDDPSHIEQAGNATFAEPEEAGATTIGPLKSVLRSAEEEPGSLE